MSEHDERTPDSGKPNKPSVRQVIVSVLAAMLGVNSRKNQEQDFKSSSPMPFIIGGIIFGVVFVLCVALVVGLVLESAG